MDSRLQRLSYSSTLTLHSCPRKYQLYKLGAEQPVREENVTFAYGHAVGEGIQSVIEGDTTEYTYWRMFLAWDADLLGEEARTNKDFFNACYAVSKFAQVAANTEIREYELAYTTEVDGNTKPAVELSFRIELPDGFTYIGFVDAVLKHSVTGELMVLELKTTGQYAVNEASYKNSSQAIGYSIVLDAMAPHASSYKVLYLIYKSKSREYELMMFSKSYTQRAMWIQQLLFDIELIEKYENTGVYPQYGESCFNYFRACEYYDSCSMDTSRLISPPTYYMDGEVAPPEPTYSIEVTLAMLIDSQLGRA